MGSHQIKNPTGGLTLSWQYKVIRLWKMNAQELIDMGKPALLGFSQGGEERSRHFYLEDCGIAL